MKPIFPPPSPKRILLIEPPFYIFFNYSRYHYPVTLTLIATYLEKLGHYVRVYDADAPSIDCHPLSRTQVRERYHKYAQGLKDSKNIAWQSIKHQISDFKPDIVGITAITPKIDSANKIAGMIKNHFPGVKVVLGGPHAYAMRSMFPEHDFGGLYDNVITHIPNLVDQYPKKQLILNVGQYSPQNLSSILAVSGCPMKCTFCGRSCDTSFIYRRLSSIKKELKEIREYEGSPLVYFMDDCFFSHTKRFFEITEMIKSLGLKFSAGGRIMALTKPKLKQFIECGGEKLYVGVESGSQRILDRIKKRLKIKDVIERTKWINEYKIPWSAFIIVGFPFETIEDLKLTETLVQKIKPTFASINRFTPYPGTEIYKEFFLDADFSFIDLFQLNSNLPVHLSQEVEDYINHLFLSFDNYNASKKKNIVVQ